MKANSQRGLSRRALSSSSLVNAVALLLRAEYQTDSRVTPGAPIFVKAVTVLRSSPKYSTTFDDTQKVNQSRKNSPANFESTILRKCNAIFRASLDAPPLSKFVDPSYDALTRTAQKSAGSILFLAISWILEKFLSRPTLQ